MMARDLRPAPRTVMSYPSIHKDYANFHAKARRRAFWRRVESIGWGFATVALIFSAGYIVASLAG